MTDDAPASTRGFLFADLRNYSSFVETHGDDAAVELLARYRTLVRDIIARHDGAEIRTEGDSFYVVLRSASSAVRCGMDILAAAVAADPPIAVGIGVHAGETSETTEGPVGSAVNIAARVCSQAAAGELLVTDTVRSLTRTRLPFGFVSRGMPRLKGIAEPIALYRVTSSDDPQLRGLPVPMRGRAGSRLPWLQGRRSLTLAAGALGVVVAAAVIGFAVLRAGGRVGGAAATSSGGAGTVASPAASPARLPALTLLWQGTGPKQLEASTYWPAIHPITNDIWVASPFDNKYWIFNPNGSYLGAWGSAGKAPGQLSLPTHDQNPDGEGAIAFAPDGSFYIADCGNYRVEKFDKSRRFVATWGHFGTGHGEFTSPKGIATDGKTVYVADDVRGDIQAFDSNGRFLRSFAAPFVLFSLAPNGHLYSGDGGSGAGGTGVVEMDANGRQLAHFKLSAGDIDGGGVAKVVTDRAGHIFVAIQDRSDPAIPYELVETDSHGVVINRWAGGGETDALSPDGQAIYFAYDRGAQPGWSFIRKYALPVGVTTFHGNPARTGIMAGPGPNGTPKIEWSEGLGGPIHGAPAVVNGVVYVADSAGEVQARLESSGALLWTHSVGAPALASVAVADGRVIVGSDDGWVTALNAATGSQLWRQPTGGQIRSSPVVVNGIVYLGSADRLVYTFDAATGTPGWKVAVPGGVSRAVAVADGVVYVPSDGGALVALSAATGALVWQKQLGTGDIGTPAVADGVVYAAGGLDDPHAPHLLYALDARTGLERWHYSAPSGATMFVGGVADMQVFAPSWEDHGLYAIDTRTGRLRWQLSTGGQNGDGAGIVGTALYLPAGDGMLDCVNVGTGQVIWKQLVGGVPSTPAVVDGRVIVGTDLGRLISIVGAT